MTVTYSLVGWRFRCDHGSSSDGYCKNCFAVDLTRSDQRVNESDVVSSVTQEVN